LRDRLWSDMLSPELPLAKIGIVEQAKRILKDAIEQVDELLK